MKQRSKTTDIPEEEKDEQRKTYSEFGITMEEARSVNEACTKWLRNRNLLYDHEAIKSFMFGSPPQ